MDSRPSVIYRPSLAHFTDEVLYESHDAATTKLHHAKLANEALRQEEKVCWAAINEHAADIRVIHDRIESIGMDIDACDKGLREVEAYRKCLEEEIERRRQVPTESLIDLHYPFQLAPRREANFDSPPRVRPVRRCFDAPLRERRSREDRLKLDRMADEERYGISEINITPTARIRAPVKRFGFNY